MVSPQGKYTKHIYIGTQRIVSKLGDFVGQNPRRVARAGQDVDGENGAVKYDNKFNTAKATIENRYKLFELPFKAPEADENGNNDFCCNDNAALRDANIGNGNDSPEKMVYFYHSDHLGSTSLITDKDGDLVQHVEYIPFGEVFIEERNNTWNTPFLFNAKELDEETGLYYYSARYYDPRTSLFLSVDPMAEEYPNMSSYAYCANNPVIYIDPTGEQYWTTDDPAEVKRFQDSQQFNENQSFVEEFDYSSWRPVTDGESFGSLTFNDETNTFYSSYCTEENGETTVTGISTQAIYGKDGKATVQTARNRRDEEWRRRSSGAVENVYPEFEILAIGGIAKSIFNLAKKAIGKALTKGGIQLTKKTFGHTFTTHGDDMTKFLLNRAKGSGMAQGQFLDNQKAAKFILDNLSKTTKGAINIPIPKGFPARVIMPDGTFKAATHIRLVPGGGGVKTAYPLIL